MKDSGKSCKDAIICIKNYLISRRLKNKKISQVWNQTKTYLTDDERSLVVLLFKMMSNMGLEIDKDAYLDIVNADLSSMIEMKDFECVTMSVVDLVLKK